MPRSPRSPRSPKSAKKDDGRTTEEKFCDCVVHVSKQSPKINPYAICTSSIYNKQGKRRTGRVECGTKLKYEKFPEEELHSYAEMKKMKGTSKMTKAQLVAALYGKVAHEKAMGKPAWNDFFSDFRRNHPQLSFSNAAKEASKAYKKYE